jgi:sugar phosphate isomerase/epimerase
MTTYRWSFLEDVIGYREIGVDAIGVWRPKLVEFGEERGVELLRDFGLAVSSVSWAGGFTGAHGHSLAEAIDDAQEAIRLASRMNAECLVILSGARAGHTANHARKLLIEALKPLAETAAIYEVCLALQPMHAFFAQEWTFLTSLDETLAVLDRFDSRWLKLAFDVYHLWQEPRLGERIAEIAPRVATVQLSDWRQPPQSESDRAMLGEGCIPLRDIIAAFQDAGYDRFFEIGIWSDALWASDYSQLLDSCCSQFAALSHRWQHIDVG